MALTVRTQFGAGRSSGSQHSQSLEALLAHIPGLTVVMPSTPADTYGLLRAAIQDPNPVVFIENRLLYGMKGPQPPADHILPIGRSAVVRPGTDVTVVSVSRMVHEAVAAAERARRRRHLGRGDRPAHRRAARHGADPRVGAQDEPAPDRARGRRAVRHRRRDRRDRRREGFWDLDAPIERIGAAATPPPYAPDLERAWLPDRDDIAEAIRRLAARRERSAAQRARDHQVLDLVGAFADLEHLRVAVEAGDRRRRACSRGRRGSGRPPTPPDTARRLAFSFAIAASLRKGCPVSRRYAARYVSQRAASSSVAMSASLNWIAWNFEMGWPNCTRCRGVVESPGRARPGSG